MSKAEKVQINKTLYNEIIQYFGGDKSPERERRIRAGIDADIDARIRREYYTQYKTAPSAEQRAEARQKYLDMAGIPASFRWSDEPNKTKI